MDGPPEAWITRERHPDDVRWEEFCRTVVDRIRSIRSEAAGSWCPTCATYTPEPPLTRTCPRCERTLPVSAFGRRHRNSNGTYQTYCRPCKAAREHARRLRLKQSVVADIIRRAS